MNFALFAIGVGGAFFERGGGSHALLELSNRILILRVFISLWRRGRPAPPNSRRLALIGPEMRFSAGNEDMVQGLARNGIQKNTVREIVFIFSATLNQINYLDLYLKEKFEKL